MMVGCWPYGIAFILLLSPLPSLTTSGIATWFGAFYIIFFLCNTFTNIPYDALGPEMTDNQKDRSKIFFICTVFDVSANATTRAYRDCAREDPDVKDFCQFGGRGAKHSYQCVSSRRGRLLLLLSADARSPDDVSCLHRGLAPFAQLRCRLSAPFSSRMCGKSRPRAA